VRFSSTATWLAPLALWLAIVSCACERTAAEPTSRPQTNGGVTERPGDSGAATGSAGHQGISPTANRCIRPTPKVPTRPDPPPGPAPGCPADPTGRLDLPWGRVAFPQAATAVRVEVTRSFDERARGLMYRTKLPEDEGMIFIFGQRRDHSFWMKNTCLALDMLFIDRDGLIVGIEENVPTLNEGSYRVGCPSQLVLEVNAGWSRRHGVQAGQKVEIGGL
jgi:uncharacterized membrane protein (UPF0127 family)